MLLVPIVIADCYCLFLLRTAIAYCHCLLLLPAASAYCYCLLILRMCVSDCVSICYLVPSLLCVSDVSQFVCQRYARNTGSSSAPQSPTNAFTAPSRSETLVQRIHQNLRGSDAAKQYNPQTAWTHCKGVATETRMKTQLHTFKTSSTSVFKSPWTRFRQFFLVSVLNFAV